MVGPGRLELPTSRLSGVRSNRLSYGPIRAPNNSKKGFIDDDLMSINNLIQINEIKSSLERRWSSHRFPYGYLVTTSPQSLTLPWSTASEVSTSPSGKTNSHGVTGGVYKARERIHRGVLIRDY